MKHVSTYLPSAQNQRNLYRRIVYSLLITYVQQNDIIIRCVQSCCRSTRSRAYLISHSLIRSDTYGLSHTIATQALFVLSYLNGQHYTGRYITLRQGILVEKARRDRVFYTRDRTRRKHERDKKFQKCDPHTISKRKLSS